MAPRKRASRDVILLPLRPEFASRIYSGEKKYELRKTGIPDSIRYVVIAQADRREVTGGYIVAGVHDAPVNRLWMKFGRKVTTKDRYDEYFEGHRRGLAIEIRRAERLEHAIPFKTLSEVDESFVFPPQFHLLYPTNPVLQHLKDRLRTLAEVLNSADVERIDTWMEPSFREIKNGELSEFADLAALYIGRWYDEIDETFAARIIETHRDGRDRFGYFTLKKKIFALLENEETAGYTVVTWKRGGSVKFGPTFLRSEFRGAGLGPRLRKRIDAYLRANGARKSYSTIPDTHTAAFKYLIRAGHSIEAHLRKHYTTEHGDLVFGRILDRKSVPSVPKIPVRESCGDLNVVDSAAELDPFTEFVRETMTSWYDDIDDAFAESVFEAQKRFTADDLSKKGKKVFLGLSGGRILVTLICSMKRGGAVKLSPFLTRADSEASAEVLREAQEYFLSIDRVRKLYSLVPALDGDLVRLYRSSGYRAEGILREPYKPGIDMIIFGRLREEMNPGASS